MSEATFTGTTIGDRYHVRGHLRGARMGDLYVARRTDDDARVLVKIMEPKLLRDDEAVRRFEREVEVLQALQHPCCLAMLDHGRTEGGLPWIVTEYVEGELLSDLVEASALPPERAARIAGRIALALQAAHDADIIHRDLQPSAVIVGEVGGDDVVKVHEFGLVRLVQDGVPTLTMQGVRIGTPFYMAPEYVRDYELDHRADLYSLGAMLFEMLVGEPPFLGRPYKVLDQHVTAPAPRPSSRGAEVPEWLDTLVLRLLEKEPLDRFESAEEVVAAIASGLGQPVLPPRPAAPEPEPEPEPEPAPAVPEVDPILEHVIAEHTREVRTDRAEAPDPRDCLVVDRVAPVSVAASAGIRPGDLLVLPDSTAAGLQSTMLHQPVVQERTYEAHRDGQRITLRTTGIPIGITALRHPAHVRAHYAPLRPVTGALLDLWKQGAWEELETLSWRTVTQQRGGLDAGLIRRFLRAERVELADHPALLLHGAALVERGRDAEGLAEIGRFKTEFAAHWPTVYNAIAHLYLGLAKADGSERLAVDLLVQSWLLHPLERTAAALERLTGERPPPPSMLGKRFPDYVLDDVDRGRPHALEGALAQLDGAQLLAICLMGGFRGNLDYEAFTQRFAAFLGWFPELLAGLHVITAQVRRPQDQAHLFEGEDLLRSTGARLAVLADERAFVQRAVKPVALPTIYLVDKQGTVVHQGRLTAPDLWEALDRAGRRRLARFRGGG